ncbi:hypothetical protein AYI70_g3144 [Smittium culicis]|uniref:Uncharacterized protein n=1 Tax=Smittium culicis TaxID=133412 RepID=A0A1R1Y5G2_9FUNG|nr:hypothetical protein AYI70_g3144 [Smittium culicis]
MNQKTSKKIVKYQNLKKNLRKNTEKFLVLNVQELKKDTVKRRRNGQWRREVHSIDHQKIKLSKNDKNQLKKLWAQKL